MEFQFTCAQQLELLREFRVGKKFHGLEDAPEARGGDDMRNGTVETGYGDQRTALGGADRRGGFSLEVLDAVCILHATRMYPAMYVSRCCDGPERGRLSARIPAHRPRTSGARG